MNTRDSYKRRVARLEKYLAASQQERANLAIEHAKVRKHYQDVVAKHIANERRGDQLLLEDRFKIQELEQQVGSQHVQLCNALEDVKVAQLNVQTYSKSLEQCRAERRQARLECAAAASMVDELQERLHIAEQRLSYRIYQGLARWCTKTGAKLRLRRLAIIEGIKARLLVLRLNKPRVEAMREAGYIPEKLVKVALDYWQHDKERMAQEEYIREVHSGSRDGKEWQRSVVVPKPSMWRKLMILIGRA